MQLIKTTFFFSLLIGLFLAVGYVIGGGNGLTIAFILSLITSLGSYWFSDRIVLAMHRAKKATSQEQSELLQMTKTLAQHAQLPTPQLYIYDDAQPNAFATGRSKNHAVIAVSTGLLHLLSKTELKGVIAHELAHIKNQDMLLASIAATFAGAISWLTEISYSLGSLLMPTNNDEEEESDSNPLGGLALMIVTPLIAVLIQSALSRSREFLADATGAQIAQDSQGLRSALAKLEKTKNQTHDDERRQIATAHLYISNPLTSHNLLRWFSTHPPVTERIARLQQLKL